jgi:cellulose synthase/poly-beta-1,6-N-acetylglucosamine synthase-like glycosyltransferase
MQVVDVIYLLVYTVILYCSILWFTVFFKNRKKMLKNPKPKRFPSITFLVPAYNEERNIERCLRSILNLNYPKDKLKVIVIDDGSTDNTAKIVRKFKKVKLIRQKNSGKASAINNGLRHVKTELVACMDADSFPDKDYLLKMVGRMEKKSVAAVTPAMKVSKTRSIIQKIQWVEYLWAIFLRKIFSIFDCQYVTPGPGSVYKKEVLEKIGDFDEKNLTEDMEIAFRIVNNGYRIDNSMDAYVYTDAERSFKELYRQRLRWYRGYIQNTIKYSHMIANPKYGNLGFFILPINFVWMFIVGFLLFSLIFRLFWDAFQSFINWSYVNFALMPLKIKIDIFLIDFYTYFGILFLIISLAYIWLSVIYSGEKLDVKRKFKFYVSYILLYPFLISIFWIISIIYEILGIERKW